jgi:hypothetical protein
MIALDLANARLAALSRVPRVQLETFEHSAWTPALIDELHKLAVEMAAEDRGHFAKHAYTNDTVHLFREQESGAVVGFQFWRCSPGPEAGSRVVFGGKLRVRPAFRRRGLHLISALAYYDEIMSTHPSAQFHRLSIASVFGFVAIASALASYEFIAERAPPEAGTPAQEHALARSEYWLCDCVAARAAESGYEYDRVSGIVNVHIQLTPQLLSTYPPEFYARRLARTYSHRNPDFRSNGCYLAFGFPLSRENLTSIHAMVERRLAAQAPSAS